MAKPAKKRKVFDGRYEILSIVGRGACSVVYHARHLTAPTAEVALKVLLNKKDQGPNTDRLRKEALAMVSSRHKYVIRLDDFHSIASLCYLTMEYAPESDLRAFIKKQGGQLPIVQIERFLMQITEALAFVHQAGIVHRDLKPDNILVVNERQVRLADFGVAVLPGESSSLEELQKGIGTMDYMAPEVFEGIAYDARSDVYSLGVTWYEVFSGTHPFQNIPLAQVLDARQDKNIPHLHELAPDVPEYLTEVIMRSLAYDMNKRYETAKDFLEALLQKKARSLTSRSQQIGTRSAENAGAAPKPLSPRPLEPRPAAAKQQEEPAPSPASAAAAAPKVQPLAPQFAQPAPKPDFSQQKQKATAPVSSGREQKGEATQTEQEPISPQVTQEEGAKPKRRRRRRRRRKRRPAEQAVQTAAAAAPDVPEAPAAQQPAAESGLIPEPPAAAAETSAINEPPVSQPLAPEQPPVEEVEPVEEVSAVEPFGEPPPASDSPEGSPFNEPAPQQQPAATAAPEPAGDSEATPQAGPQSLVEAQAETPDGDEDVESTARISVSPMERPQPKTSGQGLTKNSAKIVKAPSEREAGPQAIDKTQSAARRTNLRAGRAKAGLQRAVQQPNKIGKLAAVGAIVLLLIVAPYLMRLVGFSGGSSPLPAYSGAELTFPQLPAGTYTGSITNLIPGQTLGLTLISFAERQQMVVIISLNGWRPATINTAHAEQGAEQAPEKLRVRSGGLVLDLTAEAENGRLIGSFKNVITQEEGEWSATPVR